MYYPFNRQIIQFEFSPTNLIYFHSFEVVSR